MYGLERPVRADDEVGIIERAGHAVALGDADAEPDAVLARGGAERGRLHAGHDEGVFIVPQPLGAPLLRPLADAEAEVHPVGIAGEEQLRKDDHLRRVFPDGPLDERERFFKALPLVEEHRGGLYDGQTAGWLQIFHRGFSFKIGLFAQVRVVRVDAVDVPVRKAPDLGQ